MLHVVLGRNNSVSEWSRKISGLQFKSTPGIQESTRSGGETSAILTITRSHLNHVEEIDLEANTESFNQKEGNPGMSGTEEMKAKI
jgi:hypothetical protein